MEKKVQNFQKVVNWQCEFVKEKEKKTIKITERKDDSRIKETVQKILQKERRKVRQQTKSRICTSYLAHQPSRIHRVERKHAAQATKTAEPATAIVQKRGKKTHGAFLFFCKSSKSH